MSKIFIAYAASGLSLFAALFAAFALSGVARPGTPEATPAAEAPAPEVAAAPPPPNAFVPPALEPGRLYRISHATPVYSEPSDRAPESQTLPPGGGFTAVRTLDSVPGPWIEVAVREDNRDRTMYLYGMDLRWKIVSPVYSPEESLAARKAEADKLFGGKGGILKRKRRVAAPPPPPPPPGPTNFAQWWAATADQLGGATQANLIASGIAAGFTTGLALGAIAVLSMLRRQSSWTQPAIYTRDGDAPEDDEPYPAVQDHEDSADDDAGHRRV